MLPRPWSRLIQRSLTRYSRARSTQFFSRHRPRTGWLGRPHEIEALEQRFLLALSTTDLTQGATAPGMAIALVGTGITIENVTYAGANVAAGAFTGGTGIIGFESGIILSSGNIASVRGPNNSNAVTTENAPQPGDASLDGLLTDGRTTRRLTLCLSRSQVTS